MFHKILIAGSFLTVFLLSTDGLILADDINQYCNQVYQACRQALSLGEQAQSYGVYMDLSLNCSDLYNDCLNTSGYEQPQPTEPKEDTSPSNKTTSPTPTNSLSTSEKAEQKTMAQLMVEQAWLEALGLNQEEINIINNISSLTKDWIKPFYQPERIEKLVGLTAASLNAHDQLTKDITDWVKAKRDGTPGDRVEELATNMADAHADYKKSLADVLKVNPSDPTANFELGNEYFREGTVDDFITARRLHARALMNLDQQERINLETKVKEDIERNGFAKAFNNPEPETSSFLGAMRNDLDNEFSAVKDKSIDWLKQTEAYTRAEAYSSEVRGIFRNLSTNIFQVDNMIIDQVTYGN